MGTPKVQLLIPNAEKGADGKSAYQYAKEGGFTGTESEFAKKLANGEGNNYVTAYGAKGNGTTDDTAAFQNALAKHRTVFVPSGTYKLTSSLVIGDNCELELAQDAVLNFTQTTGNCITLGMSSTLRGNHATIKVPYAFSGIVIYAYSNDTTEAEQNAVPPWTKWCPQWKSGRYVTDINICKVNASGNHESVGGECSGTAVYLSANGNSGSLTYMWGIHYSGLRIAGAFSYGIRAVNLNEGWMNDMRVDAFIDACEIGVQLEDCHNAYISAIIQPRTTWHEDESKRIKYAKHGIKLIRSTNADLSGSRVWDWDDKRSLWAEGSEYQHIAMYGDCSGAIINDFRYHGSGDTRNRIYTNYANNLKTVTILQEPIDRWFKSTDNKPYFYDGVSEVQLAKQMDIDAHFVTDEVPNFTDVLSTSTDANGEIYNGKGYKNGAFLDGNGNEVEQSDGEKYHTATGFIPIEAGDVLYFRDIHFDSAISSGDGFAKLAYYKADKTKAFTQTCVALHEATKYYYQKYERTADGMKITFYDGVQEFGNDVSVRLSFRNYDFGENAVIAKNEEIKYTVDGFLADGVKVHARNVVGLSGGTGGSIDVTAEVGQTIIVKEVDANGKPTKWEAADYQQRIAWTDETGSDIVTIPETTVSYGAYAQTLPCVNDFKAGYTYDVYINDDVLPLVAQAHAGGVVLGNYEDAGAPDSAEHLTPNCPIGIWWEGPGATYARVWVARCVETAQFKVIERRSIAHNPLNSELLPTFAALAYDVDKLPKYWAQVEELFGKRETVLLNHTCYAEGSLGHKVTFVARRITSGVSSSYTGYAVDMPDHLLFSIDLNGDVDGCTTVRTDYRKFGLAPPSGTAYGAVATYTGSVVEWKVPSDGGEPTLIDIPEEYIVDGAVIPIDESGLAEMLESYESSGFNALIQTGTETSVTHIRILYLNLDVETYTIKIKCVSPSTGDIVTLTFVVEA